MIILAAVLCFILGFMVMTLMIMISRTNGATVQPPDVIPYVETPGDLSSQLLDSRWEDGS